MASLSSFYKSERFSDTLLVLIFSKNRNPQGPQPLAAPADAATTLSNSVASTSSSRGKRKAATLDEVEQQDIVITLPAHMLTLSEKSEFFNTILSTAVPRKHAGSSAQKMIKEFADSVEDLHAMEAVAEFIYTGKLSLFCTQEVQPDKEGLVENFSIVQRLLLTLLVATRWQVVSCQSACYSAVAAMLPADMTWDDCWAIHNLIESLQESPEASKMMETAMELLLTLSTTNSSAEPPITPEVLSSRLLSLPVPVRSALLKGGKLGHAGMLALFRSEEQVADSEDDMAFLFASYLRGEVGGRCSVQEVKQLKDELLYQHMSNAFLGQTVPEVECLRLSYAQLSQLVYLRGLEGISSLPALCRSASVPAAWYKPARTLAIAPPHSFDLTFNLSVKELSEQLQRMSQNPPSFAEKLLRGGTVKHRGWTWSLSLHIPYSRFCSSLPFIFVETELDRCPFKFAHTYAEVKFQVDSVVPMYVKTATAWCGLSEFFIASFGVGKGDPLDLSWWEPLITNGHVRFLATVKVIS